MIKQDNLHNQDPEIDLISLFKTGLNWLNRFIREYFHRLIINKWLLASIIVLSGIAGFSLRYILPKQFKTEGIFLSNSLDAKMCSLLINNLNQLSGDPVDGKLFAEKLKTNPAIARGIVSLNAEPIAIGFHFEEPDSAAVFRVKITVLQNADISAIQKGIEDYLENNEYAVKRKEAKIKMLKALSTLYSNKLKSLDSLKTANTKLIFPRVDGSGFISRGSFDPITVYQAEINYYREQLKITSELEKPQNIEVLQPFVNSTSSNYPDFSKLMLKFIAGGILLALLVVPIIGKRKA